MAILTPDSCLSNATVGEKRTYGLIQDLLPANFAAWFESVILGRYPGFIVLADLFGLLVLEVKGWYPARTVRVNGLDVELLKTEAGQGRSSGIKTVGANRVLLTRSRGSPSGPTPSC